LVVTEQELATIVDAIATALRDVTQSLSLGGTRV
jgi:hypothetical protein